LDESVEGEKNSVELNGMTTVVEKKKYTYEDYAKLPEGVPRPRRRNPLASDGYYDLAHKKRMSAASGVRECWIVDPAEKPVEVLQKTGPEFRSFSSARGNGGVRSNLLEGFEITLEKVSEV
jgi:hypothetical protein